MITILATFVCDLPVSREQMGFPKEGDRGNAVLLLADEMLPHTRAAYQEAGCIHEGVRIGSCCEEVYVVLEQLQLRYCPWPDRGGFTLVVLEHARRGVLADRMIVSRLATDAAGEDSDEREA